MMNMSIHCYSSVCSNSCGFTVEHSFSLSVNIFGDKYYITFEKDITRKFEVLSQYSCSSVTVKSLFISNNNDFQKKVLFHWGYRCVNAVAKFNKQFYELHPYQLYFPSLATRTSFLL